MPAAALEPYPLPLLLSWLLSLLLLSGRGLSSAASTVPMQVTRDTSGWHDSCWITSGGHMGSSWPQGRVQLQLARWGVQREGLCVGLESRSRAVQAAVQPSGKAV